MGTLTFGSLARASGYQSQLATTAKQGLASKLADAAKVSSTIPTGKVDGRTEQALQWSGLKTKQAAGYESPGFLFSSFNDYASQNKAPGYATPDLEVAYSFSSIKKILAYRDSLMARTAEAEASPSTDATATPS